MTIQHSAIPDADLHEPKGVANAAANKVYKADGAGSGSWDFPIDGIDGATAGEVFISDGSGSGSFADLNKYVHLFAGFDATTPAYSLATTTSNQVVTPTTTIGKNNGFTIDTSPNLRIKYTDSEDIDGLVTVTLATEQASGSGKDCEWVIYKNGSEITGSRVIRSLSSGDWGSITLTTATSLTTNDYLEIYSKASASATVNYASIQITVQGYKS